MSYILAARIRANKIEKGIAAAEKAGITDIGEAKALVEAKFKAYRDSDFADEKARILYLWACKVELGCRAINGLQIGMV